MSKGFDAVNKKYGDNVIRKGSEVTSEPYIIPTGMLALDLALGIPGYLGGRIGFTWGETSCGKTLIQGCTIAHLQRNNKVCALLDVEGTYSSAFWGGLGVDTDALHVVSANMERRDKEGKLDPLTAQNWFEILEMLILAEEYDFICLDSVPALVPKMIQDVEHEDLDKYKAAVAQFMSAHLPPIVALNNMARSFIMFVTQLRAKPMAMFGRSEQAAGGKALKFYSTYELEVRKREEIKAKVPVTDTLFLDLVIGVLVDVVISKNKAAPKGEPARLMIDFRTGVDKILDVFTCALGMGIIEQSSSHFKFEEWKTNGKDNFMTKMREEPMLLELLDAAVRTARGLALTSTESVESDEETTETEESSEETQTV